MKNLWLVLMAGAWCASLPAQAPDDSRGGSVLGEVRDAVGEPVPLADVTVARIHGPTLGRAKTDASGMFVVSGLPLGAEYVRVGVTAAGKTQGAAWARLTADRPQGMVRVRLWDAGRITGRILDGNGEPAARAVVCAAYDESRLFGFEPAAEAVVDAEGRFELEGVPLGQIQVYAWAEGHELAQHDLWLRDEAEAEIRLRAGEGVTLRVRVEGLPEGRKASLSVIPYDKGSAVALPSELRRGEVAGSWERAGLPDHEYLVRLSGRDLVFAPNEVRAKPGTALHDLLFRATERGAAEAVILGGTLRDTEQRPLVGERITIRRISGGEEANCVTDAEGRFSVTSPLAPGTEAVAVLRRASSWVLAQPFDGRNSERDMRLRVFHQFRVEPETPLDLVAQRAAVVRGRVVAADGAPVAFQTVDLHEHSPNRQPAWMSFTWSVTTDRHGEFEFLGLRPPQHELRVALGDGHSDGSEPFTLEAGEVRDGVKVVRLPLAAVEGTVVDQHGNPVPGARVWLRNCDETGRQAGSEVYEVLSDRIGRYRHVAVEPGWHLLQLYEASGAHPAWNQPDAFTVAPGATVTRELRGTF